MHDPMQRGCGSRSKLVLISLSRAILTSGSHVPMPVEEHRTSHSTMLSLRVMFDNMIDILYTS